MELRLEAEFKKPRKFMIDNNMTQLIISSGFNNILKARSTHRWAADRGNKSRETVGKYPGSEGLCGNYFNNSDLIPVVI